MKSLYLSIFKISCRYWLLLFFVLLNFSWKSADAQSGTSVYDPIPIPVGGCGNSSFSDYQDTSYDFYNSYGYQSPDVWYTFTLTDYTNVSISLCGSNFDTYLYVLNSSEYLLAYNDDNGPLCSGTASSIYQQFAPGTYYIVAEGYSYYTGSLVFNFNAEGGGTPSAGSGMSNAIMAGTFNSSGTYTDTRSNADDCLGDHIGHPSNDIYYQFSLGSTAEVTLAHCGSNFDTYIHLLDAWGNEIAYNDDNYGPACPGAQAYLQMTLAAGTYYVVSEGYGYNTGNIVTSINVSMSAPASLPVISYTNPSSFTVGTAISPVSPSNTGGAVSSGGQSTTTLAGSGYAGSGNGTGAGASFNNPLNAAVDAAGNVYVADAGNHSIRKISPSGVVTTVAGSGSPGSANGVGTSASFQHPSFIAIDASGNLFVSDQQNHRIRKVTPGGVVTTFAGSGSIGSANGTGTSASFYYPMGLTFDASGNLYVADSYNNKIRKISPAGVVSDVAGSGSSGALNGAAGSASFKHPMGLGFDAAGNLYVADRENYLVRKINTSGVVSTFAGSGVGGDANGIGTAATFNTTNNLVLDPEGNIYIADHNNNRIRKITPTAEVSTLAGTATAGTVNGTGSVVRFNSPFGIARGADGAIYVIENGPHLIRKVVLLKAYAISPALPAGLVFNDTDGTISGTPTVTAPLTTYTVTAYNGAGSGSTTLSFAVNTALACVEASQDQNYITTYMPRESGLTTVASVIAASCDPTRVQTGIQYFDGLGRPLQTVQVKGSPDKKDIVVPIAYDEFGREAKKYLPYASTTNNGAYKADGLTKVIDYYIGQPAGQAVGFNTPFSQTRFEASPLNRVLEQGAPGTAWQIGAGHTVQTSYETNIEGEVNIWTVSGAGATVTSPYGAGTLYKTRITDENGNESIEYKDLQGKVVLKKVQDGVGTYVSTYYVYDDLDNLRYVLPSVVSVTSFIETDAVFLNYIYGYHYDGRKRLIEKKIPGKGWEFMVYNKLDQLVLSQDAMQSGRSEWLFTKYDAFGRVVMTGLYSDGASRGALQGTLDGQTVLWESKISTGVGYNNGSFPQTVNYYHSLNYYDDYDFPGNVFGQPSALLGQVGSLKTKGLLTGSSITVLGTGNMLQTVSYYDQEGRVIQSKSQHYKGDVVSPGNYDEVNNTYSFTGELKESTRRHYVGNTESLYVLNQFDYDHMGRKLDSKQRTGDNSTTSNPLVLLSRSTYSDIGQLLAKGLHSTSLISPVFAEAVSYTYNPRGWLSSLNAGLFTQHLKYNESVAGVTPQYNGNISRQEWGIGKYYNYTYDKLNRLTVASSNDHNDEQIGYDVMGNISSLERQSSGTVVDQLAYNYNGNRLGSIVDASGNTSSMFQLPGATDYSYDLNGNMTGRTNATNAGNNLNSIAYNYLNLPSSLSAGPNAVSYTYDASGNKLKKLVNGGVSLNNEYIGGIHYEGGVLKFVSTEAGRVVRNSATDYVYEYTLADHLGNGRVYFDISVGVSRKIQETDYYAFGLDIQRSLSGTENKYQYNGKEKQDQEKLLDYGARFYDPVIGRWSTIDPKAELLEISSPYVYSLNNPANFIDKDGELPIYINGRVTGEGQRGDKSYWDYQLLRTIASSGIPNPGGESHFVDGDRFQYGSNVQTYNSSWKKVPNAINRGHYADGGNFPDLRSNAGYTYGKADFLNVLAKLARDPKTGKITEKIQIYTHSRGAAFGAGYTKALLEMIKGNADQFADANNVIDFVYNMGPHQSGSITSPSGVDAYSQDHTLDGLSGNDMGGLKGAFTSNETSGGIFGPHSTSSFKKDVTGFLKSWQSAKGDPSNVVDDFVKRMKKEYGINVTVQ